MSRPGMYRPLSDWFAAIPATTNEVRLTFDDIENIIEDELPPSASVHDVWWRDESENTTHSQALAWLKNGWRVTALSKVGRWVEFARKR